MSQDYGIKVSKPGYSITDIDKNMVFSSKFQSLKVQSRGSGSMTDSGGRLITIAHGLAYVPMFMVHIDKVGGSNTSAILPLYFEPSDTNLQYRDQHVVAWADSTNLYIKAHDDFGWDYFGTNKEPGNYGFDWHGDSNYYDGIITGRAMGYDFDSAYRFMNVNYAKNASFYKAEVGLYIYYHGGGNVQTTLKGIDVDSIDSFTSVNPFSEPRTTASTTPTLDSGLGAGSMWRVGFSDQFNEIITRSGWNGSGGNHIGAIVENRSNSDGNYFGNVSDAASSEDSGTWNGKSHLRVLRDNTLLNYKYTIFKNQLL